MRTQHHIFIEMIKNKPNFSLVDWTLVVAIIGTLAASFLSAKKNYKGYVSQSLVTEGLRLAVKAKATVTKNITSGAIDYCSGVNVGTTNKTTLTCNKGILNATVVTKFPSEKVTLTLMPDNKGLNWRCSSSRDFWYIPSACMVSSSIKRSREGDVGQLNVCQYANKFRTVSYIL